MPPRAAQDAKPKRVICVDDVVVTVAAEGQFRAQPFAFVVKTRTGRDFFFAADSAEARAKWMASIGNAGYPNMYQRTREAVKFLVRRAARRAPRRPWTRTWRQQPRLRHNSQLTFAAAAAAAAAAALRPL